jgi:hypothetical protein
MRIELRAQRLQFGFARQQTGLERAPFRILRRIGRDQYIVKCGGKPKQQCAHHEKQPGLRQIYRRLEANVERLEQPRPNPSKTHAEATDGCRRAEVSRYGAPGSIFLADWKCLAQVICRQANERVKQHQR